MQLQELVGMRLRVIEADIVSIFCEDVTHGEPGTGHILIEVKGEDTLLSDGELNVSKLVRE